MRKNIHKKSEARPIKNTPHKTTRNKKNHQAKNPNQKFVALWRRWILFNVYLYVHLRHNEQKNNTDNNTHHSKFLSRATTHTFSQT